MEIPAHDPEMSSVEIEQVLTTYCEKENIPTKRVYLGEQVPRTVSDARYKYGRLLLACGGSIVTAVALADPQIMPFIQDPVWRLVISRILVGAGCIAAVRLLLGRCWYKKWMDHCQLLQDAGVLDPWLKFMLKKDPSVRPLLLETALKLNVDQSPFDPYLQNQKKQPHNF